MKKKIVELSCRAFLHLMILVILAWKSHQVDHVYTPYVEAMSSIWTHLFFPPTSSRPAQDGLTISYIFDDIPSIRQHLKHAVDEYFHFPDRSLNLYRVASSGNDSNPRIPWPVLEIECFDQDQHPTLSRTESFPIVNSTSWPLGLNVHDSLASGKSWFQHQLSRSMTLSFVLATERPDKKLDMLWKLKIQYDFSTQAQLRARLALMARSSSSRDSLDVPSLDFILLFLTCIYQIWLVIDAWGWQHIRTCSWRSSPNERGPSSESLLEQPSSSAHSIESLDPWFCFITLSNLMVILCAAQALVQNSVLAYGDTHTFIFALATGAQWICIIRYIGFTQRYRVMSLTLQRGCRRVVTFLLGVVPIFIAFVLFGVNMFGHASSRFSDVTTTATTLFAVANGDEILETYRAFQASNAFIGQVYLSSYIIFFSYVVLMVCISIIEEAYFSARMHIDEPGHHQYLHRRQ